MITFTQNPKSNYLFSYSTRALLLAWMQSGYSIKVVDKTLDALRLYGKMYMYICIYTWAHSGNEKGKN